MIVEGTSKTMKKSDYWERICSNKRCPTRIQKRNLCVSSKRYIFVFRLLKSSKLPICGNSKRIPLPNPNPWHQLRSFSPTSHQCRCLGVVAPHRKFVALHKQERSSAPGHLKDCHFGMSRFGTPELNLAPSNSQRYCFGEGRNKKAVENKEARNRLPPFASEIPLKNPTVDKHARVCPKTLYYGSRNPWILLPLLPPPPPGNPASRRPLHRDYGTRNVLGILGGFRGFLMAFFWLMEEIFKSYKETN